MKPISEGKTIGFGFNTRELSTHCKFDYILPDRFQFKISYVCSDSKVMYIEGIESKNTNIQLCVDVKTSEILSINKITCRDDIIFVIGTFIKNKYHTFRLGKNYILESSDCKIDLGEKILGLQPDNFLGMRIVNDNINIYIVIRKKYFVICVPFELDNYCKKEAEVCWCMGDFCFNMNLNNKLIFWKGNIISFVHPV